MPLEVHVGDTFEGQVVSDLHEEVSQLLDLGFPLTAEYDHETRTLVLSQAAV